MNKTLKALLLLALAAGSTAFASEYRTPWLSERGPLRHTFKKLHKKRYNANMWSLAYCKEAHKAFLAHGTKSEVLTELLFNDEDFTLNQIFPNSVVPVDSENYNVFMKLSKIKPRANYFEYGVNLGGRIDFPVWENKGRIGLRTTIPFRKIEIERKDITPLSTESLCELVQTGFVNTTLKKNGTTAGTAATVAVEAKAYRLDLVQALQNGSGESAVQTANKKFKIFGQEIQSNEADGPQVNDIGANVGIVPTVAATGKPQNLAWIVSAAATDPAKAEYKEKYAGGFVKIDSATPVLTDKVGVFAEEAYNDIFGDFSKPAQQDFASKNWVVFRRNSDSAHPERIVGLDAQVVNASIEAALSDFCEGPYDFMSANNFEFESQKRSGLGDIDLDLFYEHTFCKDWMGELMVGVRFPTGSGDESYGNPYKVNLGNGEHFEIKIGAGLAWQPFRCMNAKLDMYYSFVLEGTEERTAVFAGSKIKGIGPKADADVDWGYFVGRLDLNFFHPKTDRISSTLGYEFYYKTHDHISFKQAKMESWLGKKFVNIDDAKPEKGKKLVENLQPLSNDLARKNTESISHKVRSESSFRLHRYLDMFWGGSFVFAGQNAFRDMDCHAGFNCRF
jgi:hypothetical protein